MEGQMAISCSGDGRGEEEILSLGITLKEVRQFFYNDFNKSNGFPPMYYPLSMSL